MTAEELSGEVVNDAMFTSAQAVEERFNVEVSYVEVTAGDNEMSDAIRGLVSSNDDTYAVVFGCDGHQMSMAVEGHFYNIKDIEQFNFDKAWWTASTDAIAIGNKAYVGSTYLSLNNLRNIRLIVMNKDLASTYGMEVPYEQALAGEWYLDDMIALAEQATQDTNGNGTMDWGTDTFGFATSIYYIIQPSLGVSAVKKDKDNLPYLDFDVERSAIYLDKMEELGRYSVDDHDAQNLFPGGTVLFGLTQFQKVVSYLRDSEVNYAYLPMPKLDELQTDYISVATDTYWGIPICNTKILDLTGTITEALHYQHYTNVRPAFYETTMKDKLAGNETDIRILDLITENLCLDFGYSYQGNIAQMTTFIDLYKSGVRSGTIASTYAAAEEAMKQSIEELIRKYNELP